MDKIFLIVAIHLIFSTQAFARESILTLFLPQPGPQPRSGFCDEVRNHLVDQVAKRFTVSKAYCRADGEFGEMLIVHVRSHNLRGLVSVGNYYESTDHFKRLYEVQEPRETVFNVYDGHKMTETKHRRIVSIKVSKEYEKTFKSLSDCRHFVSSVDRGLAPELFEKGVRILYKTCFEADNKFYFLFGSFLTSFFRE